MSSVVRAAALAVLLVTGGLARADDAQQARDLFNQGNTFFDLGQFDKAIEAWQNGYQLKNDPGFLYNIAQAYRTTGDAQKAIFAYKRYLSNAPKAHNRAEVEQKVEALQKQLAAQPQAKQLPPPAPLGPESPTPAPATSVEPPPAAGAAAPQPLSGGTAAAGVASAGVAPEAAPMPEPAPLVAYVPPRRVDLAAALGFDTWAKGVQGSAKPSFAYTLGGGYSFGGPTSQVRFRLGVLFGYTFLSETDGRDTFLSLLLDPGLDVRLSRRFRLDGDLALGVLSVGGLKPSSSLLDHSRPLAVSGTQALFETRLGVDLGLDLTPAWSLFGGPAVANSPKKKNFYADITRVELLFGVAYRP